MNVFYHLVYEYQKGLRDLCLFTSAKEYLPKVKKALTNQKIEHVVYHLDGEKMNVFFGMPECLKIVEQFSSEDLTLLTPEEDFILGMMLGYAKAQQYQRFLGIKKYAA